MRTALLVAAWTSFAPSAVRAQTATVVGDVVTRDGGEPLGFATISTLSGTQRLASERGTFVLRDLPPGVVQLRVRQIGFAPKDTTLTVAANDTARVRIVMTRLAIALPKVVVEGACTDRTPFEPQPPNLAALFDQVRQNAERMRLLARERPFVIQTIALGGARDAANNIVGAVIADTSERGPLPPNPYVPRRVVYRVTEGPHKGAWGVAIPELSDIADTAFTNNHCFWYAGQERLGADSVIRVDFEPVPWLAKAPDLTGSIYLRVDGYQLVATDMRLSQIPAHSPWLREYYTRARFREIVPGVPLLDEWQLTNIRNKMPPFVHTGRVTGVRWLDPSTTSADPTRPPRR